MSPPRPGDTARAGVHSASPGDNRTDVTASRRNWRPGEGWGTLGDHGMEGRAGGQQHSRVHVREEPQLAGEDLGQQHPHEGPAQGAET